MRLLLDTCILIDLLRLRTDAHRGTATALRDLAAPLRPAAISVVTVAELRAGLRAQETPAVERLLGLFEHVPVDVDIAIRAGDFLRHHRRAAGVELGDALIAATAAVGGFALWTHNVKHFPMPELTLWTPDG